MTYSFPTEWSDLQVALSHDWLTGMRGGERVLEILCQGFPNASISTLVYNEEVICDIIRQHPVHTSWLQHVPSIANTYRNFLPLFPSAINSLPPVEADLIISTSHCVAKALRSTSNTRHLCYCFTPMRYAWTFYEEYFGRNPMKGLLTKPLLAALRRWDYRVSSRVDRFVAISEHVRDRIQRFYHREADVVYPPVDTQRCTPGEPCDGEFDLIVSAMVPYKRVDLAISAYRRTGFPLKVVGVGGQLERLKNEAGDNTELLGWQSDEEILDLYRRCRMLIFPGEEDFGIVPLEAQSCGKPVIAYGKGGALETIQDGVSGLFFAEQTEDALLDAVARGAATDWNPAAIRAHAERFGIQNFIDGIATSVTRCMKQGTIDTKSSKIT